MAEGPVCPELSLPSGNVEKGMERRFRYHAENRQITAAIGSGGSTLNSIYTYTGDGQRVKAATPSGTTYFVYDAAGQMAVEIGPNAETGTQYLVADHLGSTRLITANGSASAKCLDYLPFGETIPGAPNALGRTNECSGAATDNTLRAPDAA